MKILYFFLVLALLPVVALPQARESCSTCLPQGIKFSSQNQIDNFKIDFPGCTIIEGSVEIEISSAVTNLDSLNFLTKINGNLIIAGGSFQNLKGLDSLSSIGGNLIIGGLILLENLEGLNNLDSIGGNLQIYEMGRFVSLLGMENLIYIGGDLNISSNSLFVLGGLNNLKSIGGNMNITHCVSLRGLYELFHLTSIGGSLTLSDNWLLTSLSGINNIAPNSITELNITDNYKLASCDVESICEYLVSPNGYTAIFRNAPGCNSKYEVNSACGNLSINDLQFKSLLSVYPNPTDGYVILESPAQGIATIYNLDGERMIQVQVSGKQTVIDIRKLPNDVYVLSVAGENYLRVSKLVKINSLE